SGRDRNAGYTSPGTLEGYGSWNAVEQCHRCPHSQAPPQSRYGSSPQADSHCPRTWIWLAGGRGGLLVFLWTFFASTNDCERHQSGGNDCDVEDWPKLIQHSSCLLYSTVFG